MNTMQLATFATTKTGLTGTVGQSGSNRTQTSKQVQAGKDDFSRILERTNGKVNDSGDRRQINETSGSNTDTQPYSRTKSRTDTETESKINAGDKAKPENDSAADQSVTGTGTSITGISVTDQSVQDIDPYRQAELLSQLVEILQILGFAVPEEGIAGIVSETGDGGQVGQPQVAAMLNPDQLKVNQTELKQILTQLIDILNKQGALPKGLSELKMTAESGLSMNDEISVTVFLDKLLETAKQAAQPAVQSEKGTVIPLEIAATKSTPEPGQLRGAASEAVESAPDDLPKVTKVTTVTTGNSASGNAGSFHDLNQNSDDKNKDSEIVVSGFKALNNNAQHNSSPLQDNGSDVKFPLQSELQVSGQISGQASPSEAATMPRMTQLIFSQIAQKAKLVVAPGTAEMQIQLKPDFLGKLNLNISTDNGMVTAKFTAESHAVKGIIEANLNTLKDALAQQGVKVDQLVVDVGTQNQQSGFENRQSFNGNGNARRNLISVNNQEIENLFSNEVHAGAIKDYYGSTVEYTA